MIQACAGRKGNASQGEPGNQCHGPSNSEETPRPREVKRGAIRAARATAEGTRDAAPNAPNIIAVARKNGKQSAEHGQRANQIHATQGNKWKTKYHKNHPQ